VFVVFLVRVVCLVLRSVGTGPGVDDWILHRRAVVGGVVLGVELRGFDCEDVGAFTGVDRVRRLIFHGEILGEEFKKLVNLNGNFRSSSGRHRPASGCDSC